MPKCLLLFVMFWFFGTTTSFAQVVNDEVAAHDPSILDSLPYVDISDIKQLHSRLHISAKEQERAIRYDNPNGWPLFNVNDPKRSDEVRTVTTVDGRGVHPLPFIDADLVAVGIITSQSVSLNKSGTGVYSSFSFSPSSVLAGSGEGPLVFDCYGGVVLYPSGKKLLIGINGNSLPVSGHEFLLFLKKVPHTTYYEEIAGFSMEGRNVIALDKYGKSLERLTPSDLLARAKAEAIK